jgi:serine/threonine protein kinase/DNA polymerase III delta prime subunit
MTPERWQRVKVLFEEIREQDRAERPAFLQEVCAGDEALREEVESLLAEEGRAGDFMEAPVIGAQESFVETTILHYKIVEKLGEGGMGVVYKARDSRLDRFVALKVLPPGIIADPERKRRFVQEARAASVLNHPNIITIYDIAHDNDKDLIVMEYVSGKTLGELIGRTGLPPKEALRYAVQIADALATAHSAGIIHRDLKPSNIMVTEKGLVKVLDFGLAKLVEQRERGMEIEATEVIGFEKPQTLQGTIAGTPAYMSPEQAGGKSLDARSDIFSFGSVLYEMITGAQAFPGDDQLLILAALATDEPATITSVSPSTPVELERVIIRALRKDPEQRWQSMADLKVAFTEIQEGLASGSYKVEEFDLTASQPKSFTATFATALGRKLTPRQRFQNRQNRSSMIARVRHDWIEGVLHRSLYSVARLELGLEQRPDAVDYSLSLLVGSAKEEPRALPTGTKIHSVFQQSSGALLILGAPGSGKTTLLLELASDLLDKAERNEDYPIPVVFNLSGWKARERALAAWLADELTGRFGVPRSVAEGWVDHNQVLPLLDGLDEVGLEDRRSCVAALNDFRSQHGLLPIAVCCRSAEYETVSQRLRLPVAVCVRPLTREQIDNYLTRAGRPLEQLRMAVQFDEELWELFDSPLMLSVASLAFRGTSIAELALASVEQQRSLIFSRYIDAMLRSRTEHSHYSRDLTMRWLGWLASVLGQRTVFQLEDLRFSDVPENHSKTALTFSNVLPPSLASACASGLIGVLTNVQALLSPMMSSENTRPADVLRISWRGIGEFGSAVIRALSIRNEPARTGNSLEAALDRALATGEVSSRMLPGEGIRRSARNALLALLLSAITITPFLLLAFALFFAFLKRKGGSVFVLMLAAVYGVRLSRIPVQLALNKGGIFCIQHYLTRSLLWLNGIAPLKYTRFLDYATDCVFLRKVGGGYIFIHRLLMEHFAESYRSGQTTIDERSGMLSENHLRRVTFLSLGIEMVAFVLFMLCIFIGLTAIFKTVPHPNLTHTSSISPAVKTSPAVRTSPAFKKSPAVRMSPTVKKVETGTTVYSDEAALTAVRKGMSLDQLVREGRAFVVAKADHVTFEKIVVKADHAAFEPISKRDSHDRLRITITDGPHKGKQGLVIP